MYKYLSPQDIERLQEELKQLLDARFNHRDFSILNKRWKGIHNDQVIQELLLIIDKELEIKESSHVQ